MFLIRQAGPRDFSGVFSLAKLLDSYNLPADPRHIRYLLKQSKDSFAGKVPRREAHYLFVVERVSPRPSRIVGCSLIIAKHGTPKQPHLWFALDSVTMRSRTLGIRKRHQVLKLGYTKNGPTEVGGLILLPGYRKHPLQCGLQLSYIRFLYMAMHPERFEPEVLVEYRGAMGRGKRSPFWEEVGKVFTGLPYGKADRLSVTNKEFIWSLLPKEPIYCALLPKSVQRAIGAIHPDAAHAARLLRSIGFKALPQIEPFDGGPYYTAPRRRIRLIRETKRARLLRRVGSSGQRYLVATEAGGRFRAVAASGSLSGRRLAVEQEALKRLNVNVGDKVHACPISR